MGKSKRFKQAISMLLVMFLVISGISVIPTETQAAAGKIILAKKKVTLYAGEYTNISVKKVKNLKNAKIKCSSSNSRVATVSSKGYVSAKKKGKATITVTSKANKKVKAKFKVTVKSKPKKVQLTLKETNATIKPGETYTIQVKKAIGLSSKAIECFSANGRIATVTPNGKITGISAGNVGIVICSAVNKKARAVFEVSVKPEDVTEVTPQPQPTPETPETPDITEPEVTALEPGLYDPVTNTLKIKWADLLANGTIKVDTGYISTNWDINTGINSSSDILDGKLIIPENDYIGFDNHAFAECDKLTEVTIPVTYLGEWAFRGCENLQKAVVSINAYEIGIGTFQDCVKLTSVSIQNNVTKISQSAFRNCSSLCSIELPPYLKEIEGHAFSGCTSLSGIIFPNTLTKIGVAAFDMCSSLETVMIPDSVTSLGSAAFRDCTKLRQLILPVQLEKLPDNLIQRCTSIVSLYIPETVTTIGNTAFAECSGLTAITIPNAVTVIEQDAFYYCTNLTEITIPDGVTEIGDHAFDGCEKLAAIYYNGTAEGYPWAAPLLTE
ncbi:MAG: leucine-rich repeat protein [Lachnospiraceae bacterium]|nr:leucine-rich repeat protein [Lachnospiraceae bacterium]